MRAVGAVIALALAATGCDYDRLDVQRPAAPVLRAPRNGAYIGAFHRFNSRRPSFRWEPAAVDVESEDKLFYELDLSTDAKFASDVRTFTTDEPSYVPEADLPVSDVAPVGTRYYWRVRACAPSDLCSASSTPRSVNVGRSGRDLNGDGFDDIVAGAYRITNPPTDTGHAYVYFGQAGSLLDGSPDGSLSGVDVNDQFGTTAAIAGDLNGDGFADFIIGAPFAGEARPGEGRAYIYFGGPGPTFDSSPETTLVGGASGDRFGAAVSGAGDLNGDGFDDVIVGAPSNDEDGAHAGRAYVYLGGPGAALNPRPDAIFSGFVNGALGYSVAPAGDVNGDGLDDVVVGANATDDRGFATGAASRVHLYLGRLGAGVDTVADASLVSGEMGDGFGSRVSSADDLDGDGYDDLVVPAMETKRVYLYRGGPGPGFDAEADALFNDSTYPGFGVTATFAGDLDGDGLGELAIGAYRGGMGTGVAGTLYLYRGKAGGLPDAMHSFSREGYTGSATFASAIAAAGDLNGDGRDDLIVGAANSGGGAGDVYYVLGTAGELPSPDADVFLRGPNTGTRLGSALAGGLPR